MKARDEKLRLDRLRRVITDSPLEGPPKLRWISRAPQGIKGPGKSLAVLPSSFNPPTVAHQALIESARAIEPIDEVLLVLDKQPLDKEIFGASLEERLLMILLCFEKDTSLSIAFTNRGLFVEKLSLIMRAYPEKTVIKFVVGYDTLIRILDPKYYENRGASLSRLFADSLFLVATRGEAGMDEIKNLISQERNSPYSVRIRPFEIPFPIRQVSSTQIRNEIERGRNIDHLVPSEIVSYIKKTGHYRNLKQG
jgi:nicotinamide-nucleotide adenylyltransferase